MSAMPGAEALRDALRAEGMAFEVEGRDRLAVVVPQADFASFADPALGARLLELGARHGFTHVAVEIPSGDGAALRRD